jgi:hypothetical protein
MSRCQLRYFDIVTENFAGFDSEIGLYDSTGSSQRRRRRDGRGVGPLSGR